jgi:hypothetical protein
MTARGTEKNVAVNDAGDVVPGAQIEVRLASDNSLATLYAASTGSTTLTNPFDAETDPAGEYQFWVNPGEYVVSVGVSPALYTYPLTILGNTNFATRALLKAAVDDGGAWPDGTVITAGNRQLIAETGYDSIGGDLDGLRPLRPRIAVIGDSLSLVAPGRSYPWPKALQDQISQVGVDCEFQIFAVGGASFTTALNNFWKDAAGNNIDQVDKAALSECDAVIVALGYNNAFTTSDTIAEAKASIDAFVTAIKAATSAPVFFIRQYVWDRRVITPDGTETAIPNRLVIPQLHANIGPGVPSGTGGSDRCSNHPLYFDNDIGATARGKMYVLQQMNDYLVTLASGDAQLKTLGELDFFTVARMGCHTDGLHVDEIGHRLLGANLLVPVIDAMPELFQAAFMAKYEDSEIYSMDDVFNATFIGIDYGNDEGSFYDPDRVIGGFGRDYIVSGNTAQTLLGYHNYPFRQRQDTWYIQYFRDIVVTMPTSVYDANTPFTITLQNMPATDTVTVWNPNAGTWQTTRTGSYNGKGAGFNTFGNLSFTTTLAQLYGVSTPPGATDPLNDPSDPAVPPLDIGIRIQSSTWPEGYAFLEFWGKLQVLNDLP